MGICGHVRSQSLIWKIEWNCDSGLEQAKEDLEASKKKIKEKVFSSFNTRKWSWFKKNYSGSNNYGFPHYIKFHMHVMFFSSFGQSPFSYVSNENNLYLCFKYFLLSVLVICRWPQSIVAWLDLPHIVLVVLFNYYFSFPPL